MNNIDQLKEYSEFVKQQQNNLGQVISQHNQVLSTLHEIINLLTTIKSTFGAINDLSIIAADITQWIEKGIDQQPDFKLTAEHLVDNYENLDHILFVGPYRLANSGGHRGFRFEFFFADVDKGEFLKPYKMRFPHPCDKTLSLRLLSGSDALFLGNNVVFFPEGIDPNYKNGYQNFAIFFFDKFRRIYLETTINRVEKILGESNQMFPLETWCSKQMTTEDMYNARCLWGYIHDLFHFKGPRPFGKDIGIKTKWELGLLEEIKVDCQTFLFMHQNNDIQFSQEIMEFILFERIFRYPAEADAENNFDAGTGVFLFNWLNNKSVIEFKGNHYSLHTEHLFTEMQSLIDMILEMEELPDEDYKVAGIELVFSNLLQSSTKRFTINPEYLRFSRC